MRDEDKTKEQLLEEVASLRARLAELERSEAGRTLSERRVLRDATHDDITGLYSHPHLLQHLSLAVRSARRYEYPLSVCLCRLAGLKAVYETQGEEVAEDVLAEFGELVRETLRGDDIAGRCGKDEFCVVFSHTVAEEAAMAAERVLDEFELVATDLPISPVFGIAQLELEEMRESELLELAEDAMEEAEQAGDGAIVIGTP